MDLSLLAAFVAVDLLLVLTPGADWAYAISAGLRGGRVVPAVAGLLAGYVLHAALVVVGVGALLARNPAALQALTLAGAGYLVWLGVLTARRPAVPAEGGAVARSARAAVLRGAAISGLNPKGVLLFFAVLPQFTDAAGPWPVALQLTCLALVHITACGLVYLGVATAARSLLRARPRAGRAVSRLSGTAMAVVGVLLLGEQAV
jgi:threonine/homoserine/homoserine lactone efflux protein